MKKVSLFLITVMTSLYAFYLDDDMDGVENADDRCPNSAITDIVDAHGCATSQVTFKQEQHIDISLGYVYTKYTDKTSQTSQNLSLNYYYGAFSAWLYSSTYNTQANESGLDDTTVSFYYRWIQPKYSLKIGLGSYLSTSSQNGNKTDYFITAKAIHYVEEYDFSAIYQHIFMRDKNTKGSDSLSLSTGYSLTPNSYISLSYIVQTSIYQDGTDLRELTLYLSHFLNDNYFINGEILHGLDNSTINKSYSINIGYFF